jgi:hypothetical protein
MFVLAASAAFTLLLLLTIRAVVRRRRPHEDRVSHAVLQRIAAQAASDR